MHSRNRFTPFTFAAFLALGPIAALSTGCGYQALEPGHRGLRFDPHNGGLKGDVLQPGIHNLGWCFMRDCGRIEDFDVTYQTKKEDVHTPSTEGLAMDLKVAIIFRPVIAELHALNTEVGQDYYEEVVGPELRSAARSVLARHSFMGLVGKLEKVEDEIEAEVRRRIHGKHVEVASITLEQISYAPEIAGAVRAKLVGEQEAIRQKAHMENEALRKKAQLDHEAAHAKQSAENQATQFRLKSQFEEEQEKRRAELTLLGKQNERALTEEQARIDKMKAIAESETRILRAKGQATEITTLAKAHAEENRAQTLQHSQLSVQAAGYEALAKLGGTGTTILLGDWSRAPQFLYPRTGVFAHPAAPVMPTSGAAPAGDTNPYGPASTRPAR